VGRKPKSANEKAEEQKHLRQLGEHLKELREAKNLTPQDLADKLGVTPQYIYMIESGKAKPSESRLNELARALGDLADEFLTTAIGHVEEEFATKLREAGRTWYRAKSRCEFPEEMRRRKRSGAHLRTARRSLQ
jgi:transcriptional regulator with XRE-family HTH domain